MNNRVTQLISAAEKYIETRQYSAALEYLTVAEHLEPHNKSIRMIRDLITSLQAEMEPRSLLQRFLSATVSQKPASRITPDQAASMEDVQRRIRSLTASADYSLTRGAVDNAFELLMRAYLLDPVAPEVLACERRVLPLWQKLHGKSGTEAKQEWKISIGDRRQSRTSSRLFERLKSGKLLDP